MTALTEQAGGPWLDMSAYPNLAPDDAVPAEVLGVLRDVLRTPQVTPLHPDTWHDVLHGALHSADPEADVADPGPGVAGHDAHDPGASEHEAQGLPWQSPGGAGHTWHGPGTDMHTGGLGGHGSGSNDFHDGGFHDGGFTDGSGH